MTKIVTPPQKKFFKRLDNRAGGVTSHSLSGGRWHPLPRPVVTFLAALVFLSAAVAPSAAVELLTNGDFETGNFTGWTVANRAPIFGDGDFFIDTSGTNTPPMNGIEFATASNPLGGNWYAVSTSDAPGTHALLQDFTVPALLPGETVTLSFQMFVNDQSGLGPIEDPSGLDHTTGGTFNANQHARVDLLKAGAGDFSTTPADVLMNFYHGVDNPGGTLPNPYTSYNRDITSLVSGGGTFRLRFAEVDNLSALNVGVQVTSPTVIPEPSLLTLLLMGALVGVVVMQRQKKGEVGGSRSRRK